MGVSVHIIAAPWATGTAGFKRMAEKRQFVKVAVPVPLAEAFDYLAPGTLAADAAAALYWPSIVDPMRGQ